MKIDTSWHEKHGKVIHSFLDYLNKNSNDYILKGGTSLMTCYKLDRFSEDIDLDGRGKSIAKIVDDFCKKNNFTYRTAKDTETVKRYMIHYGNQNKPLKIEISFRKKHIDKDEFTKINGINVYNIDTICMMKTNAYNNRDKIRDLYDLTFICNHYWEHLSSTVKSVVRDTLSYKGIEQFDYLIKDQSDHLIDNNKLVTDFLKMFDKLDLLVNVTELNLIKNTTKASCELSKPQPITKPFVLEKLKTIKPKEAGKHSDKTKQQIPER